MERFLPLLDRLDDWRRRPLPGDSPVVRAVAMSLWGLCHLAFLGVLWTTGDELMLQPFLLHGVCTLVVLGSAWLGLHFLYSALEDGTLSRLGASILELGALVQAGAALMAFLGALFPQGYVIRGLLASWPFLGSVPPGLPGAFLALGGGALLCAGLLVAAKVLEALLAGTSGPGRDSGTGDPSDDADPDDF